MLKDGVHLSYALNGARDNPEMESFIGHFKSENESLLVDAADLPELREVVARQMHYYNAERRHSSLDYCHRWLICKRHEMAMAHDRESWLVDSVDNRSALPTLTTSPTAATASQQRSLLPSIDVNLVPEDHISHR